MSFYAVLYTKNLRDRYFDAPKSSEVFDEYEAVNLFFSAASQESVYHHFQGDVWSPNGEACDLIEKLGLFHTSMSIGDIVVDIELWKAYIVARFGFEELPFSEGQVKAIMNYVATKRQEKVGV